MYRIFLSVMSCNKIFSRQDWESINSSHPLTPMFTIPDIVVFHHYDIGISCSENDCMQAIRNLQKKHMEYLHDIAYNFIIGENGFLYEGRGWRIKGAHTNGINFHSIGVLVMGNYLGNLDFFFNASIIL